MRQRKVMNKILFSDFSALLLTLVLGILVAHGTISFNFFLGLLEQSSKAKIEGKALPFLPSVGVVDEEKMR